MADRSYSLLTITKADAETREISGVMSTPETDRVGDQVNPLGMKARLPAPCLWQHDSGDPIGEIVWVDPKPDGIRFRAKLAKIESPASLKERLDSYFSLIKAGIVKGISIGFRPLEMEPIATGWFIKSWELLEASVVTIPANASCSISTVKALSNKRAPVRVVRLEKPVSGARKALPIVKLDNAPWPKSEVAAAGERGVVADALLKTMDEHIAEVERAKEILKHPDSGMIGAALAATAQTTDAELAALRARLAKLENKR
jgi:HK97 family phage prohead protease